MASLYSRLQSGNQLLEVGPDDLNILIHDLKSRTRAIGTKGLNGCTCVVILGMSAIILAHISPYPGDFDANTSQNIPQQSHQHHETSLAAVTSLMKRYLKHFPPSTTAWGVFASNEKSGTVQSIISQVRNCLRELSLDMKCAYYQEENINNIIPPKGELISFFKDSKPQLILERKQLWPSPDNSAESSAAAASGQLSTATSSRSYATPSAGSTHSPAAASLTSPQTRPSHDWAGYPTRITNEGVIIQKLFYGIGHPKWFSHLRNACRILRRKEERFPTSNGSLPQSFRLVKHVEDNNLAGPILRRYALVDLIRHRNGQRRSQRVSTEVLVSMLREACPELRTAAEESPEFEKGFRDLKHALYRGRHWYALSEKFGPGILALVPAHPAFGLSNMTDTEDMPNKAFDVLIDALEAHSGDFLRRLSQALSGMPDLLLRRNLTSRYKFEDVEGVEDCEPGSEFIIDSCTMDRSI